MLQPVVKPAQRLEVRKLCLAAVEPGDLVVDVAPTGWPEAAWMLTVPVPGDHCPPHRRRYHSRFAAYIERFRVRSQDQTRDRTVAGQVVEIASANDGAVDGFSLAVTWAVTEAVAGESVEADNHQQVGFLATPFR